MKKNYKILLIIVGLILIGVGVTGGTYTYFRTESSPAQNQVNTKSLELALVGDVETEGIVYTDELVPGGIIKKEVAVQNTKDLPMYVRVVLYKYWMDVNEERTKANKDYQAITEDIYICGTTSDWIIGEGDEDEQLILYYKKVLQPGETTSSFMKSIELTDAFGNTLENRGIGIEIEANGVQIYSAQEAMMSEWGVMPEFSDTELINVKE